MKTQNQNTILAKKMIDLYLAHSQKESYSYLIFLKKQINFYQAHLLSLQNTRLLFFQKKKQLEHSKKIQKCEQKIIDLYIKIEEELNSIHNISNTFQ